MLMLVGGLGLTLAVLSSPQPPAQIVTAAVLVVVGLVNLCVSPGIWRADMRNVAVSGAAAAVLIAYLAVVLGDFGEPLWRTPPT